MRPSALADLAIAVIVEVTDGPSGPNTKGYSSTDLAMGFANVRAGTQTRSTRVPFCIAAGHLTVSGYTHMQYRNLFIPNDVGLQRCLSIAWITVQKQASASLPAAWLPPAQNAWWQKELPQKSAVGLLVLN